MRLPPFRFSWPASLEPLHPRHWLKKAIRRVVLWGAVLGVAAGTVAAVAVYVYTGPAPDPEDLWSTDRQPSFTVLDRQGQIITIKGDFHSRPLGIEELPPHLVEAFLAIEDQRFYEHYGIDPYSVLRAVLANIHAGRTVQGASTITQQVAKNLYLTPERSMSRKALEAVHAVWLERHLTKDEILKVYLNRIYLGAGTYGVDAAARLYFGKPATQVSLPEAAMLAGLPKAPSRFAPTSDLGAAQGRARLVLANMRRAGFISPEEESWATDNPAVPVSRPGTGGVSYFVDAVMQEAGRLIGVPRTDVVVETTIDLELQALAEASVEATLIAAGETSAAGQAALVSMDRDGAIRAMVGGRAYEDSQFNRATQALRQPGSAFKPFIYLAALEQGFTPSDPVFDEPVRVGNWTPENYGGQYLGRISVRQALAKSVNSVAVYLSETVGRETVIGTAQRLGVTRDLASHRSIALGTVELSLLDLTGAYLPFARQGWSGDAHMIARIVSRSGDLLYEREQPVPERLFSERIARDMTHMLYQVIETGTGRAARIEGHQAAGKTGTSQNSRDGWFLGYTGHMLTGVWVGNDNSSPMNQVTGGTLPAQIWQAYMAPAHAALTPVSLPGGYEAQEDRFGREELRRFLDRLRRDLDRVRSERVDLFARAEDAWRRTTMGTSGDPRFPDPVSADGRPSDPRADDPWDSDRYDWRRKDEPPYQTDSERQKRRWWPF